MSGKSVMIEEPKIAKLLFSDTRFGWLWLPLLVSWLYVVRGGVA